MQDAGVQESRRRHRHRSQSITKRCGFDDVTLSKDDGFISVCKMLSHALSSAPSHHHPSHTAPYSRYRSLYRLPIPLPIPLPFFIMSLAVCALINISINIIVGTMSPAMINERDFVAGFLSFPSVPPYFSYPFSRPIFPHHFPQRPLLSGQIRLLAGIA